MGRERRNLFLPMFYLDRTFIHTTTGVSQKIRGEWFRRRY